jgi:exosome complex RNA-binding protein Rrp4
MDATQVIGLIAPILQTGPVASIAGALNEGLKLVNHLTRDDPIKQAKAQREYLMSLDLIVKEVQNAAKGEDVSAYLDAFSKLLDSK